MSVRVLVADDQAAIRSGLVLILRGADGIEVVGEAGDGVTAVSMAKALRPDVTLMDVRMPRTDGIEATRQIIAGGYGDVLVLTTFDLDEYVYESLRAGASGFLLKSVEAPALVQAVRQVAAGDGVLAPGVTKRLLNTFATSVPSPTEGDRAPRGLGELTERERDVLRCLADGLSNQQISTRLEIGEATVKTHVSRVLFKLDLRSRVQAAILARDLEL